MKVSSVVKAEKMFIALCMWRSILLQATRQDIYVLFCIKSAQSPLVELRNVVQKQQL